MIEADFNAEMQTALGGNLVDVELGADDFTYAFNKAKRVYIQRGNNNQSRDFHVLNIVTDQREYDIPSTIHTIRALVRPSSSLSSSDPFSSAIIQDIYYNQTQGYGGLLAYDLSTQLVEMVNKYSVHEAEHIHDKVNSKLKLTKTPTVDATWFIDAYSTLTDDQYRDVLWVQDWTLSELKVILGRAYSKFSSLPSPSGETSINGDILIQEAKEEQRMLIEQINDYVDGDETGLPIVLG